MVFSLKFYNTGRYIFVKILEVAIRLAQDTIFIAKCAYANLIPTHILAISFFPDNRIVVELIKAIVFNDIVMKIRQ